MRILTAPYEDRDGWEMNVMLLSGTLYLEEHSSEAVLHRKCVFSDLFRLSLLNSRVGTIWNLATASKPTTAMLLSLGALLLSPGPRRDGAVM